MTLKALNRLNIKLKDIPDELVNELESYLDFLVSKNNSKTDVILDWHKEEILSRIAKNQEPTDAFAMLEDIENSNGSI